MREKSGKPVQKCSWTPEEDEVLTELVRLHGPKKWSLIAHSLRGRVGKQCRERWHNHLNPEVRKDAWTPEEDALIFELVEELGTKWATIAKTLKGRTDNSIKNRYYSSLKKHHDKHGGAPSRPPRHTSDKEPRSRARKRRSSLRSESSVDSSLTEACELSSVGLGSFPSSAPLTPQHPVAVSAAGPAGPAAAPTPSPTPASASMPSPAAIHVSSSNSIADTVSESSFAEDALGSLDGELESFDVIGRSPKLGKSVAPHHNLHLANLTGNSMFVNSDWIHFPANSHFFLTNPLSQRSSCTVPGPSAAHVPEWPLAFVPPEPEDLTASSPPFEVVVPPSQQPALNQRCLLPPSDPAFQGRIRAELAAVAQSCANPFHSQPPVRVASTSGRSKGGGARRKAVQPPQQPAQADPSYALAMGSVDSSFMPPPLAPLHPTVDGFGMEGPCGHHADEIPNKTFTLEPLEPLSLVSEYASLVSFF